MKYFLIALISLLSYLASASDGYRYDITIKSKTLKKLIESQSYATGGSREGRFFEDLQNSAALLKQKEIDEFYGDKFPYEISDYYILVAIDNAKAENNMEIAVSLSELQKAYRSKPRLDPKVFKQNFIAILSHQFDQRIERLALDFNNRLQKHNGDYNAMLREYQPILEEIEHQKFEKDLKKFALFTALGGASFVTVFMGIPLVIPFLLPW